MARSDLNFHMQDICFVNACKIEGKGAANAKRHPCNAIYASTLTDWLADTSDRMLLSGKIISDTYFLVGLNPTQYTKYVT